MSNPYCILSAGSLQALLFIIIHDQYAKKPSEVDELQAPCCYSYFSSQDEFMHIKPRTCSTAIIHEAKQAHSWYWLGTIPTWCFWARK